MTRLAALIAALVLTAVACGGDSTDSGGAATTTTTEALPPATTTAATTTTNAVPADPSTTPEASTTTTTTVPANRTHVEVAAINVLHGFPPPIWDAHSTPTTVWHRFASTSFGSTSPTTSAARRSLLSRRSVPAGSRSSRRSCPSNQTWTALTSALGIPVAPEIGERIEVSSPGAPALAGTVVDTAPSRVALLVEHPAPGTAFVAAEGHGDHVGVSIWSYLYGDAGAESAERDGLLVTTMAHKAQSQS